jgi:hypothetical protein
MLVETLFALAFLALLAAGLYQQRKMKKGWLEEERYYESGDWIDKRAGERGTFGSLDREREQERKAVARQTRIRELAEFLRDLPGAQTAQNSAFFKDKAVAITVLVEKWLAGEKPVPTPPSVALDEQAQTRKKQVLQHLFQQYPKLLDLDVDDIKRLDDQVAGLV